MDVSDLKSSIFNGFGSTVPHSSATWRDGLLSDWIVVVQNQSFLLHRYVLGLGIRSSAYFYNQFHFNQTSSPNRSVLEIGRALLCTCSSEKCRCPDTTVRQMEDIDQSIKLYFPDVLEYMYEGTVQFTEDNIACIYAVADFLQIGNLLTCMEDDIFDLINKNNVVKILMAAEKFRLHSGVIIRQCVELLAKSFLEFSFEESSKIPPAWLHQIFSHQDCVLGRDHVVRFILRLLRENCDRLSETDVLTLLLSIADHNFEISGSNALYLLALTETFMQAQFDQETRANHRSSLELLQNRCYDILAWSFYELPLDSLTSLPVDCILQLLDRDDLHILSEDQIYDHICHYMDANPVLSDEEALAIWKTCRFTLLSAETLWRAQTSTAPKNFVLVGAILAGAMHRNEPFLNAIPKDISGKMVQRRIVCPLVGKFAEIPDSVMAVLPVDHTVKHLMSNQFVTYPARGSVKCNSSLHTIGWRLKISAANIQGLMVGLISVPNGNPRASTSRLGNATTRSWAFQCQTGKKLHNGKSEEYGSPCADGDVIDMILSYDDSSQGTITFYRNGHSFGVAFTGIRGQVAPAVTLFRRNQQISMSLCRPATV